MNVYHTFTYSVQAVQGPTYVWATQQADFGGAVGMMQLDITMTRDTSVSDMRPLTIGDISISQPHSPAMLGYLQTIH